MNAAEGQSVAPSPSHLTLPRYGIRRSLIAHQIGKTPSRVLKNTKEFQFALQIEILQKSCLLTTAHPSRLGRP